MTALAVVAPARPPRSSGGGHDVGWVAPAPLWPGLLGGSVVSPDQLAGMQRPALLRLTSDDFMADLTDRLTPPPAGATIDPMGFADLVARPATFRPGPPGAVMPRTIDHVKLFQPVHGHFNLVAATLVCRVPGLPDRTVDPASDDEVGFVLRRVSGDSELAWTGDGWSSTTDPELVSADEELLPMFPVSYPVADRRRRLFVGLVPTSSSASAKDGGASSIAAAGPGAGVPADRRLDELDTKVIRPLGQMSGLGTPAAVSAADRASFVVLPAAERREASRFVLLDLADLLARYAGPLWAAVLAGALPAPGPLRVAYVLLRDSLADTATALSWLRALSLVWAEREAIWGETGQAAATSVDLSRSTIDPAILRDAITKAWPTTPPTVVADFPSPKLDPRPTTRYVVRCLYRRPRHAISCPDVVSAPSTPFAIASFFDIDAPARPVQIALPVDTTIAGLRKAPRNVSVIVSKELRQQMERLADAKLALKGEAGSAAGVDFGQICSFSLPIITICALLVLMIFVSLLNIVFWWVPFLRICFPLQLKGPSS